MIEFFLLYQWALLAALAMAPALALVGCHLAARDKAMQTLCIGQGASLGVLLGLGILKMIGAKEALESLGPVITAVLFSTLTFYLGEYIVSHRQSSKNTFYSAIFASLLGLSYLVCSLFPPLENHMTQIFFGDLATLSDRESVISILLGAFVILFMVRFWKPISRQSFFQAIFGERFAIQHAREFQTAFNLLSLVLLSYSVQFLGFLFTVSCLFLPTTLMCGVTHRSLIRHYWAVGFLASVCAGIGFALSLTFTRMPTVPTIGAIMVVSGLLLIFGRHVLGNVLSTPERLARVD